MFFRKSFNEKRLYVSVKIFEHSDDEGCRAVFHPNGAQARLGRRAAIYTGNGMIVLPRTIACRSNDPCKYLH